MTLNRFAFIASALVTAAFLAIVAIGVASSNPDDCRGPQRAGLAQAIDGLARETLAGD